MKDKIRFNYEGNFIELPIFEGVEGEKAIDIRRLRNATGLVTYDPGYKNTGSCKSSITYLDGEAGILRYRGYSIEDLCENCSFIEVIHLLIFGHIPSKKEKEIFLSEIREKSLVDEDLKGILKSFPKTAHPMCILASLTAGLVAFTPKLGSYEDIEQMRPSIIKMLAAFPILASWTHRKSRGLPLNYANNSLTYVGNIAHMMFRRPHMDYKPNPIEVKALNKLLILHADHEQNCSSSTVRIVGSSHADLFPCIAAGLSALWGKLHGGANQAVIEMLEKISVQGNDIQKFIDRAKDKNDPFRLMGFGHRVYKNYDPRAKILKNIAKEVLGQVSNRDPILDIAIELEQRALEDDYFKSRKLYPNVDFYSGLIYRAMDIPTRMFTVMFALGRLPGWISQWLEMRQNNEPIGRPRQIYVGPKRQDIK
ncbi:MAG: citrate synthase [Flavobacteriaceae bacterium]|nr:citrate synthase [Flavobacteriaceae bacterium]